MLMLSKHIQTEVVNNYSSKYLKYVEENCHTVTQRNTNLIEIALETNENIFDVNIDFDSTECGSQLEDLSKFRKPVILN